MAPVQKFLNEMQQVNESLTFYTWRTAENPPPVSSIIILMYSNVIQ